VERREALDDRDTDGVRLAASARLATIARIALAASSGLLARPHSGADVGLVEIFAFKQQYCPTVLCHCVRKAVAEVELRGMSSSLAVARKSRKRSVRLLVGNRGRPDCCHL